MSFPWAIYGSVDEGSLTGIEIAKDICITKVQVAAHKTRNLEHPALPAGSSTGWRASVLGSSAGLCLFWLAQLVEEFLFAVLIYACGRRGPSGSGQFQELPGAFELFTS